MFNYIFWYHNVNIKIITNFYFFVLFPFNFLSLDNLCKPFPSSTSTSTFNVTVTVPVQALDALVMLIQTELK